MIKKLGFSLIKSYINRFLFIYFFLEFVYFIEVGVNTLFNNCCI